MKEVQGFYSVKYKLLKKVDNIPIEAYSSWIRKPIVKTSVL